MHCDARFFGCEALGYREPFNSELPLNLHNPAGPKKEQMRKRHSINLLVVAFRCFNPKFVHSSIHQKNFRFAPFLAPRSVVISDAGIHNQGTYTD